MKNKNSSISDCTIIELEKQHSEKAYITVVENNKTIPFEVKRVYYLYDVPGGESRGGHAHKELSQLIIAASGSFNVILDDGNSKRSFTLNCPHQGLYVVPGIWRELDNFSSGSVCLVLASQEYRESDYIREYEKFSIYKKHLTMNSSIYFRLIDESDASFIYSLRKNPNYNKYLSSIEDGVEKQIAWIKKYKEKEIEKLEYYYIIHRKIDDLPIGTVRIYDFIQSENSFCWGSWILNENKTKYAALECAVLIYDFAFFELGFNRCHMDIRKGNKKVIEFHKRLGVQIVSESEIDYFGHYYKTDYIKVRNDIVQMINKLNSI